mmetsp:Transcript_57422/g.136491  ORF Transcript_57422/g.136491 Transcript_57422/m.136491 type:complete len:477 (-) Transcript_57422:133-1563(-)|eukprot:CAMPEP_0178392346 /NCGR_PEP_ID=MMETSP0689_2-20121128/11633_1 /TAXON_ID=160604 /ORGANISM="Amphidinium massartii, Strain CS-259" /LENGTH=476 /DNA_ID=CAMNT_0020012921 /DNA_START=87 /DNA_END=1517 /DNA_ORIENTATION=+
MGCTASSASSQDTPITWRIPPAVPRSNFLDEYTLGDKLGSGAFGQVRLAVPQSTDLSDVDMQVAVKIMDMRVDKASVGKTCASNINQSVLADVKSEVAVWRCITGAETPHCIRLHEVFWNGGCCFMVMQKCDATLLQELQSTQNLTEPYLGRLFSQMIAAVSGLHHLHICHRDIKPDNFLVNRPSQIKLGDFGLAAIASANAPLTHAAGTAPFMSPEMLRVGKYNELTDVWSLGVLMYVLLYGEFPHTPQEKSNAAVKMAIRKGTPAPTFKPYKRSTPETLPSPSSALEELVRWMLVRDPMKRPSAQRVLSCNFWRQLVNASAHYDSLPSFRPLLLGAIQAGAFTAGNPKQMPVKEKDCLTESYLLEMTRLQGHAPQVWGMSRSTTPSSPGCCKPERTDLSGASTSASPFGQVSTATADLAGESSRQSIEGSARKASSKSYDHEEGSLPPSPLELARCPVAECVSSTRPLHIEVLV